jgi:hypothetical protein
MCITAPCRRYPFRRRRLQRQYSSPCGTSSKSHRGQYRVFAVRRSVFIAITEVQSQEDANIGPLVSIKLLGL